MDLDAEHAMTRRRLDELEARVAALEEAGKTPDPEPAPDDAK